MAMITAIETEALELARQDPIAVLNAAYDAGKWVARGVSGARSRARKRRSRRRSKKQAIQMEARAPMRALPAPGGLSRRNPTASQRMSAPVAMGSRIRQSYSGLDTYRVKHEEYISDINGSVNFSVRKYRINAADIFCFPWLSSLAPNFEKYRFSKLEFKLKPQAPSTKPGVVMLAFDYDPTDAPPPTKAAMMQYDDATRVNSWSEVSMKFKPVGDKYTATSQSPDASQQRLEDAASLFVATQAQDDSAAITELWVSYVVELKTPQARSDCDTFGLFDASWAALSPFNTADIVNSSALFAIDDTQASSLVTLAPAKVGIVVFAVLDASIDITINPPYTIEVRKNGVAIPAQYRSIGDADVPVYTIETNTTTLVYNLNLVEGDVLSFIPEDDTLDPSFNVRIYPFDV